MGRGWAVLVAVVAFVGCADRVEFDELAAAARARAGEDMSTVTLDFVTTITTSDGKARDLSGQVQRDGAVIRAETWEPGRRFREGHVLHQQADETRLWKIFDESVDEVDVPWLPAAIRPERWYDVPTTAEAAPQVQPELDDCGGIPCHVVELQGPAGRPAGQAAQPLFEGPFRLWITSDELLLVRAEGMGTDGAGLPETRAVSWSGYDGDTGDVPAVMLVERGGGDRLETRITDLIAGPWDRPELVPQQGSLTGLELMAQEVDHRKIGELIAARTTDDFGSGPERDAIFHPDEVLAALALAPGDAVADIGAGEGYFSFPLARAVGPEGTVWAAEVNPAALDLLRQHGRDRERNPHRNVQPHLSRFESLDLPVGSIDLAFMCNVTFPRFAALARDNRQMLASIHAALRPGGRFAVIEKIPRADATTRLLFTGRALVPLALTAPTPDNQGAPRGTSIVTANFEQAGFRVVERLAIVEGHDFVIFDRP